MAGTAIPSHVEHRSRGIVGTKVTIVTDASGDSTEAEVGVGFGRLVNVFYDGGLDASAVITVKDGKTGATLFAYTTGTEGTAVSFCPQTNVVDPVGTAVTAADTAINVWRPIYFAGKVNVLVASGGNAETGIIKFVVDESEVADPALTV
jgi:hypothetical protein